MQKWEYLVRILAALVSEEVDYLTERYPDVKKWSKYSERALERPLESLGEEGWELVHMQPIPNLGGDREVFFQGQHGASSNYYFCVFKRPKP